MTAEVVGTVIGIGYLVSVLLGFILPMYLIEVWDWPSRPAFAAYVIVAALGPVSAIPLALFVLWLLGRFTVRGAREAWRLARPATGGNLPRARVK